MKPGRLSEARASGTSFERRPGDADRGKRHHGTHAPACARHDETAADSRAAAARPVTSRRERSVVYSQRKTIKTGRAQLESNRTPTRRSRPHCEIGRALIRSSAAPIRTSRAPVTKGLWQLRTSLPYVDVSRALVADIRAQVHADRAQLADSESVAGRESRTTRRRSSVGHRQSSASRHRARNNGLASRRARCP